MANPKKKKVVTKKHQARKQREAQQIRIIIIATIAVAVIILGLVGYGAIEQLIIRPQKPIAEVGDTVITTREFETRVKYSRVQMLNQAFQYFSFYQQFGEFGASFLQNSITLVTQLNQPVILGNDVLDEMIDAILIREEAEKREITVSDEEIDEALQAAFGFYPDGTPTPTITATIISTPTLSETQYALVTPTFTPTITETPTETPEVSPTPSEETAPGEEGDPGASGAESAPAGEGQGEEAAETPTPEQSPTITLTPTITSTPTPYTTEVYAEDIKEFNSNYAPYNFDIDDLRGIIEVDLLRKKLIEEVTADLEPVKDEVWARHILVETEEQALEVLQKLEEGEDWHTLAAEYSIDDSNKFQGGDLGWFDDSTMVGEFTEAAFSLEIGEISDPVETSFGFHLIQVLGNREIQVEPREFEQMKQEAFTTWLNEIRNSRDDIVIYDLWEEVVPTTPEVPPQLEAQLMQAQQPQQPQMPVP
jgi:parvulin-like peptidyl-prolyl isomerase